MAVLKYRDPTTKKFVEMPYGSGGDSIPIDSVIRYDGDTVPEGYEEVESNFYTKQESDERYIKKTGGAIVRMVTTSFTMSASAGEYGYKTVSMTIPTGYTSVNMNFNTSQIANTQGLQLTPIYGVYGGAGTRVIYIQYYSPRSFTNQPIDVYLQCIRNDSIDI